MLAVRRRIAAGPAGSYYCEPPWTTFHLDPVARRILGLDEVTTLDVADLDATQADPREIRYGRAFAHTVRSGEPLVVTNVQRRHSDRALRTLATVTDVHYDGHDGGGGGPVRLQGHVLDITDDICGGGSLADQSVVGIVECGPALVVLLCGEYDSSTRDQLADTMAVAAGMGHGSVYFDVRHLRFSDAAALTVLTDTAHRLTQQGRQVVLLHPSPILQRMLAIFRSGGVGSDVSVRMIPGLTDGR